jgi:two-component system, NtrC family, sensor kinase
MPTHRLLQRQLKRYLGSASEMPEEWQGFLDAVNDAYWQTDEDVARLERTLDLSSQELLSANSQMQSLLQTVEAQVEERTAQLQQANEGLQSTLQELQQTQAQLIQTEKMSSLGHLVAGIAHEINNPVSFIQGNLRYAKDYVQMLIELVRSYGNLYPDVPEIESVLNDLDIDFVTKDLDKVFISMGVGAERIKQIVLSLRNFSRMDESGIKWVDLHEGLENSLRLLEHRLEDQANPSIQIYKQYDNLPQVECFAGQINQVFMHLLNNAIDALLVDPKLASAEHVPTIWIETRTDQDHVTIQIKDNGVGILDLHKPHVFDPFFTTKPVGSGTGLGLSVCYQVAVQQHGGKLDYRSEWGKGSEFWLTIPLAQRSDRMAV